MIRCTTILLAAFIAASAVPDGVNAQKCTISGANDRKELSLVVYNDNLSLVREQRVVSLGKGRCEIRLTDVGRMLLPSSVIAQPGDGVQLLEQRYLYNQLNRNNLLDAYLGREVVIELKNERTGAVERKKARILANDGGPVVEVDGEVMLEPDGELVFPEVPEGLVAEPVLSWLVESPRDGAREIAFSYLTNGVSWQSEYVLTVGPGESKATLGGWVTISNSCGADFRDAAIYLLAGDVNREVSNQVPRPMMAEMRTSLAMAKSDMGGAVPAQEKFEYYRYDLPRRIDVLNNQSVQVELFAPLPLEVEKIYRFSGSQRFFYSQVSGEREPVSPSVILSWKAGGDASGQPLPAGLVRVYEQDGDGEVWFAGEDRIKHIPAGEKVNVSAGKVFDIRGVRRQLDFQRLSDRLRRVSVEIELVNNKSVAATVQVDEPLPGDWKIIEKSHDWEKLESGLIRFSPRVPAGSRVKVSYTVEFI